VEAIAADAREPEVGDERELVARCRGGDSRAFEVLVQRHHRDAYRLALRIVRSERDAEEVAQDAFVRAWRAVRGFRGESAFSTWIYRIVVRRALDRAAALKVRRAREVDLDAGAEVGAEAGAGVPSPLDAPASDAAVGPADARLTRLLAALPPAQRAAVSLFYYEDLPVKEVARILVLPEGTVKTHLSRARAALRRGWLREARMEATDEMR
jgi:RNA polymerase sigma-70 factor (ECF subfamily)